MSSKPARKKRRKILIYAYLGIVGGACGWILLGHVLAKNRIIDIGRAQRDAEHDIADLHRDILDLRGKVDEALQPRNLKERLARNRTRLRDIFDSNDSIAPVAITSANATP